MYHSYHMAEQMRSDVMDSIRVRPSSNLVWTSAGSLNASRIVVMYDGKIFLLHNVYLQLCVGLLDNTAPAYS